MRRMLVPLAVALSVGVSAGPALAQDAAPGAEKPAAVRRAPASSDRGSDPTPHARARTREHRVESSPPPASADVPQVATASVEPASATPSDAARSQRRGGGRGGSGSGGAVSRPREGRPATGTARPRGGGGGDYRPQPPARGGTTYVVRPYRWYGSPYGYYPFGFGLSSYYFDPFWASPWAYGSWGYGGYGYGPGYGPAYGGGYGGGQGWDTGSLRLKVKPRHAEVYVDGYLVGSIDEFDGVFQSLPLEAGTHSLEIRADGYESLTFDIRLLPQRKITYEGELLKR